MKITSVEVCIESSVRIGDYKYIKPRVGMTAEVGLDETYEDVYTHLKNLVLERLKNLEDKAKSVYKPD